MLFDGKNHIPAESSERLEIQRLHTGTIPDSRLDARICKNTSGLESLPKNRAAGEYRHVRTTAKKLPVTGGEGGFGRQDRLSFFADTQIGGL